MYIYDKFDSNYAGSWEAMWRISAIYLLFLTTTFKFYLVPTFSTLEKNGLKKEVFKIWKTTFPIIVIITLGVYISKDLLVNLLFTDEFVLINSLILFHLLGDIVKINLSSAFSIYFSDLYNYQNPEKDKKIHYYNAGGSYSKGINRYTVNYGRQRGGLVCTGGICRYVPESTGLSFGITTSFF